MKYFQPVLPDPKTCPCKNCGQMWDAHVVVKDDSPVSWAGRNEGELRSCPTLLIGEDGPRGTNYT